MSEPRGMTSLGNKPCGDVKLQESPKGINLHDTNNCGMTSGEILWKAVEMATVSLVNTINGN